MGYSNSTNRSGGAVSYSMRNSKAVSSSEDEETAEPEIDESLL